MCNLTERVYPLTHAGPLDGRHDVIVAILSRMLRVVVQGPLAALAGPGGSGPVKSTAKKHPRRSAPKRTVGNFGRSPRILCVDDPPATTTTNAMRWTNSE